MKGGEKMNKLLLLIIAVAVIAGGFVLIGNKKPSQAPTAQSQPTITVPTKSEIEPEVITLTSTGFTPKDITVLQGTRIIWKNESGKTATVHSDDHPTHRLFPILNLGEFGNGSSVQVVLSEEGVFKYHNHLNASETGSITVE